MSIPGKNDTGATIAFFLQDLEGGGAERAIVALAGDIARQGHRVELVVGDATGDYRHEVSSRVPVVDFGTRSRWCTLYRLMNYLRQRKPKTVMAALDPPNILLVIAAKLVAFNGKTVISQRAVLDASLSELKPVQRIIMRTLQRYCFPRADMVISNSQAAANEIVDRLGIARDRVMTIRNSVDMERIGELAKEAVGDHAVFDKRIPLVISVGSLSERKDYVTLIRAFARVGSHRQANMAIVGEGEERAKLEAMIRDLKLEDRVFLIGFDANPYKWISKSSVFVSSSKGEGFPNVIAEALSLGVPIVATDCPGDTAALLGNGKWGRLVPVGDVESMASAIEDALDAPKRLDGRVRAADFSPEKTVADYLSVLLPDSSRPLHRNHRAN